MDKKKRDALTQGISLKQALPALSLVVVMLIGFATTELYSRLIGGLILLGVFVFVMVSYARIPKDDKNKINEAVSRHEKSTFGRIVSFAQLLAFLFLLYTLAITVTVY